MMKGLSSTLLQVVPFAFALIAFYISVKKGRITRDELVLNRPRSRSAMIFWILGFAIFAVAVELALYSYGLLEVKAWDYPAMVKLIRSIGIVLLAPITEELLFRGLILSKLRAKGIKTGLAVIIQAIVFVLLHGFAYDQTLSANIGILQTFTDGCLFALARLHTRSIYTSIGMHMCGNALALMERLLG
jgi:membrane protease YdiL (CAAX protease family)